MDYFEDTSFPEDERRNTSFQMVLALRELLTIAKDSYQEEPYKRAVKLLSEVDPQLFSQISPLLRKKNENDIVKQYQDEAEIKQEKGENVTAEELIQTEISRLKNLLTQKKKTSIERRVVSLKAALEYLQPEYLPEDKSIHRDYNSLGERHEFFLKPLYKKSKYADYKLPNNNLLRVRICHPDNDETITGADLIYEKFDIAESKVRFFQIQYKSFDSNEGIYLNNTRNTSQINKINNNLCKGGYCSDIFHKNHSGQFRLPFCSGFWRPTDRITSAESKLATSGYHLPICSIKNMIDKGVVKVTKEQLRKSAISSKIFEELFLIDYIGSRWISIDDLEEFYEKKGIVANFNTIRIHAQDVS
jgi:hypothetical protein